jgi:hypothetical protein
MLLNPDLVSMYTEFLVPGECPELLFETVWLVVNMTCHLDVCETLVKFGTIERLIDLIKALHVDCYEVCLIAL